MSFVQMVVSPSFRPLGWARVAYARRAARRDGVDANRETERKESIAVVGGVKYADKSWIALVVQRKPSRTTVWIDVPPRSQGPLR